MKFTMKTSSSTTRSPQRLGKPLLHIENLSVFYNRVPVLQSVHLMIHRHHITGLIGPSGCGKSTLLRCLNRTHELTPAATTSGRITLEGKDLHRLEPVAVRRRIGMVFQRPNPFPRSVYENIALGLRVNGYRGNLDERVETALKQVGLWDEVKHKLRANALSLSVGQQQRLCIARAIALNPEVILLDEPCSALDPRSTSVINDLLLEMRQHYTLVLATHNLQQAARVTDHLAFFNIRHLEQGRSPESPRAERIGYLVECDATVNLFQQPTHKATWDYLYSNAQHFPFT